MSFELDKIDYKILTQLQINARVSDKEISRIIHLSPNAVTNRIKHFEDNALILKYTAIFDKSKIGRNFECFAGVILTHSNSHTIHSFKKYLKCIPEVYQANHINGTFDFIIHVVATDLNDYYRLMTNKLNNLHCVRSTTHFVVLDEIQGFNALDLSHLVKRFD